MNRIKHIIQFHKLMLVWQAPNDEQRIRYVVGDLVREGKIVSLRYLKESFDYKKAVELGFEGYPAFKTEETVHTIGVLDAFMRRLPPRERGDFQQYLENLRLPISNKETINDFELLGYSGAKLLKDSFSIVPSFETSIGACEFLMDVAGFRHISKISKLELNQVDIGTEVYFESEPENIIDSAAIRILFNGQKIGYVTRAHLPAFHQWLKEGRQIKAVVERKDEHPDNPVLYLFVEVAACG